MFKMLFEGLLGGRDSKAKTAVNTGRLARSLDDNIKIIKDIFVNDENLVIRRFNNQKLESISCCVIFLEGMVDAKIINDSVILPVMYFVPEKGTDVKDILGLLQDKVLTSNNVRRLSAVDEMTGSILYGDTILMAEGSSEALIISSQGWQTRAVTESPNERVIRGPRECFTESILINISLLRRKLLTPDLKFKRMELGQRSATRLCISYLESLANQKILSELEKRLNSIDIDGILGAGYIEELIKDSPLSPFDTTGTTEKPDVLASKLLEGRICVFIDGTPFVLFIPYLFMENFQAPDDYYQNFLLSSFNRLLRIAGFFLTTSVPAIYVAITTFHQEMIPTPLIESISAARMGVPFPTIVEALLMTLVFEILREAGIRLPEGIGQAVSIVGALVLGEAAVTARLVSAPMVIIIALTGITGFLVSKMPGPAIILRVILLLLSSALGLYGYVLGIICLFIHLVSIRSFGIPYMMNYGSMKFQDIKDLSIRAPWWLIDRRPGFIARDRDRLGGKTSHGKG